jgi:hypothetical protein
MSGDVILKKLLGYFMKLMLTMKSFCMVCINIPISVTVNTQILFCFLKLIKLTNLHKKDTASLLIIYILQHPASHPLTKSIQTTIVNSLKTNFPPLPVGKSITLTKCSTQRRNKANVEKSGFEGERV